jgi:hypothetical protein
MKKDFTLSVPRPCHERWSEFTPTEKGRFCGCCQKEVIDFTQWNEDQIKHYFRQLTQPACGRFRQDQLTTYTNLQTNKRYWFTAPFIAFMLLILSRPAEAQSQRKMAKQEQVDQKKPVELSVDTIVTKVTLRGVICDSVDGSPLPGVNVVRKGTTEGAVSDHEGKYELVILQPKSMERLVFSFIGYSTSEVDVPINKPYVEINTDLNYDKVELGEVVVVGGVVSVHRYSPRRLWWKVKNAFRR